MKNPPMVTATWRQRWVALDRWDRLHRVSSIVYDSEGDGIYGLGVTVCGQRGELHMPGVFSRMYLPRCKHCCKALDIPDGDGCPFNVGIAEPGDTISMDGEKVLPLLLPEKEDL